MNGKSSIVDLFGSELQKAERLLAALPKAGATCFGSCHDFDIFDMEGTAKGRISGAEDRNCWSLCSKGKVHGSRVIGDEDIHPTQ